MKISFEWIQSLLPEAKSTVEALARDLTNLGLEVEKVTSLSEQLRGIRVVEVLGIAPHPKSDKLQLATVSDGTLEQTVVCGAPNVKAGLRTAYAALGVTLPNGLTLAPKSIRGVVSEGMLCSEEELGLSNDHDGILELPQSANVGLSVAEVLGLTDSILELGITPNRPDALSHWGVARDLAALYRLDLNPLQPQVDEKAGPASGRASVSIEAEDLCPRYYARVIEGVQVGPSPSWVQDRLRQLGLRPISNVVDATNYVLMELGQPLHAFDLDRLDGHQVAVRRAREGEDIRLLDGSTKQLQGTDLVIADNAGPVALAGVMGGARSEVFEQTTRVLLESAHFFPASIRKTSKRVGLHTDASYRFERGADPKAVKTALDRCAGLIADWSGGTVCQGVLTAEEELASPPEITLRQERIQTLLGIEVSKEEVQQILTRLGLVSVSEDPMRFRAPSWRPDLRLEVDLVEEVLRVHGVNKIPSVLPSVRAEPHRKDADNFEDAVRTAMVSEGFLETISVAFASPSKAKGFSKGRPVRVANPLGEESRWLRPSLLPALLEATHLNQTHLPSVVDLALFEVGRVFGWDTAPALEDRAEEEGSELPTERNHLAVLLRGRLSPKRWNRQETDSDAFDLAGVIEGLFDHLGLEVVFKRSEVPQLHPRSASSIEVGGVGSVGILGELHPDLAKQFGLSGPPVLVAELSLSDLEQVEARPVRHKSLPRFPPANRDLSFFVDLATDAKSLTRIAEAAAPPTLERVEVFDVYRGQGVPEGQKSIALELVFRAADRTLSEAEIAKAQDAIIAALRKEAQVKLRDAGA